MENSQKYFFEIVYLRAFAILAVIGIHVASYFTEMTYISILTFFYMSVEGFSRFAVPLFVCISGFLLFSKYQGTFPLKSFYKKRLLSVVPQYTIFSLFAILFVYSGHIYYGEVWNLTVTDIIYAYLTGTAFLHLWFFVLIIQLYILYPVIEKIFTLAVRTQKTVALLIFLLIAQILYWIFFIRNVFSIASILFFGYLFYFVLGMFVSSHYQSIKNRTAECLMHPYLIFFVLLSGTILAIGNLFMKYFGNDEFSQIIQLYNGILAIAQPFYYMLIFVLCLFTALKFSEMRPNRITELVGVIGNYSFGIYLIHVFILYALVTGILPDLGFTVNNWLFFPVVFTLVLTLSMVFVFIVNKIPYHEFIIGSVK
jgi:surface polysaccharide O-acyltransferase-like enzyme